MRMINKILLSLIAVLCLDATVTAQNKQVSGTVTDPAGAPVVGATVLVEGTATIKELRQMLGFAQERGKRSTNTPTSKVAEDEKISLDPILTRLQMKMRLVIADFEYNVDRRGNRYGWGIARYTAPETLYDPLRVERTPTESFERIYEHLRRLFPNTTESKLLKLIG